jgi:transposase-like protein
MTKRKNKDDFLDVGRPPVYDDNHHPYRLYAMFWDNSAIKIDDVAKEFGVHRETINDWINKHPRFSEAYTKCRGGLKGMLLYAAINEALGYDYYEEASTKDGIQQLRKKARPQAGILKLLLSNFGIKEQIDVNQDDQPLAEVLREISGKLPK